MIMKKRLLFILFFLLNLASAIAQGNRPPSPPGQGGRPGQVDDVPAPIDEHLWVLVILAVSLGLFFMLSKRFSIRK